MWSMINGFLGRPLKSSVVFFNNGIIHFHNTTITPCFMSMIDSATHSILTPPKPPCKIKRRKLMWVQGYEPGGTLSEDWLMWTTARCHTITLSSSQRNVSHDSHYSTVTLAQAGRTSLVILLTTSHMCVMLFRNSFL